jgi:hypothetical protein
LVLRVLDRFLVTPLGGAGRHFKRALVVLGSLFIERSSSFAITIRAARPSDDWHKSRATFSRIAGFDATALFAL